jgi:hypothetical protein
MLKSSSNSVSPSISLLRVSSPTSTDQLSDLLSDVEIERPTTSTTDNSQKWEEDASEKRSALLLYIRQTKFKKYDAEFIAGQSKYLKGEITMIEKEDALAVLEIKLHRMSFHSKTHQVSKRYRLISYVRFWKSQHAIVELISILVKSTFEDGCIFKKSSAIIKTLSLVAFQHNELPLILDQSAEVPSVFTTSFTTPPYETRKLLLEILPLLFGNVAFPQLLVDQITRLAFFEFKYAVLERFRTWKVQAQRKLIFDKVFILLINRACQWNLQVAKNRSAIISRHRL